MNGNRLKVTINVFRDPPEGYRVSTFGETNPGAPERIDTERNPPEGTGTLGAVGFWIDVTVAPGSDRAAVLEVLHSVRQLLINANSLLAQSLWADGRATISLNQTTQVHLGGGQFPEWNEYLRRYDRCVEVLRSVRPLAGLDRASS